MVVGLEIQYGRQNFILFVLSCHGSKICQKDSPHQNVFKLTLSQKSFYVFRKDRQCKFKFLLSPNLDLINIISVRLSKLSTSEPPYLEFSIKLVWNQKKKAHWSYPLGTFWQRKIWHNLKTYRHTLFNFILPRSFLVLISNF